MKNIMNKLGWYLSVFVFITFSGGALSSCTDEVDDTSRYTSTGEMIIDFLKTQKDYSSFCYLLSRVKTTNRPQSSTLEKLLSARGNYTCFAPTNEAIQDYLDKINNMPEGTHFDIKQIPDSIANELTRNCLIDNRSGEAYKLTDFPSDGGSLEIPNMNDRYITISVADSIVGNQSPFILNGKSRILGSFTKVEGIQNGVIHLIDHILDISNSYLPDLLSNTTNMQIFSVLLQETGWADSMMIPLYNEAYELNRPEFVEGLYAGDKYDTPEHLKTGFTAFVETDSLYQTRWGIPEVKRDVAGRVANKEEVMKAVEAKIISLYGTDYGTANQGNYKHPENPLNKFVAYHLIRAAIPSDKLVLHWSEPGYSYKNKVLAANAWNYFETMSPCYTTGSMKGVPLYRHMMKITEGSATKGKRINRYSTYEVTSANYDEKPVSSENQGILISIDNGKQDNQALNGFYYPISDFLVFSQDYVVRKVLNERLRYDVSAVIPEFYTNNLIRLSAGFNHGIPNNYLSGVTATSQSRLCYIGEGGSAGWSDFNGDEFNVVGQYDFTYRMPPLPANGDYEIRFGCSINTLRGMAQIYFGEDKNNLKALGVPLDLRLSGMAPSIGAILDKDLPDEAAIDENDKVLRTHGYMKGPKYIRFSNPNGTGTEIRQNLSGTTGAVRKIIYTGELKRDKVYYLRFKSVLENPSTQFYFDYIEIVPKTVYNSPNEPEDKW